MAQTGLSAVETIGGRFLRFSWSFGRGIRSCMGGPGVRTRLHHNSRAFSATPYTDCARLYPTMSQHAQMNASTEPTSTRTLPFELIELIASQLDQPSLACFALVSKACYKTACPELYHTLRLGVARYPEEEVALDMARKLSRSIKALSRRKELCRMVQAVEFEGFG